MPTTTIRYIEHGEAFVAASHPSLDDTLNRAVRDILTASGMDPDQPFDGFIATASLEDAIANLEAADDALSAALASAVDTLETADAALSLAVAAKVASVGGTANRVTIGGTATAPTVDIATNYQGQATIVTLGTITTGIWHGTAIDDTYLATIATAGKVSNAATTATANNTVNAIVARDANGDFAARNITAALVGNASTATALATARNINGVAFDGTANITVTAASGTLTGTTLASNVVTSSLTAVGTIATGVWQGTAIQDSYLAAIDVAKVTGLLSGGKIATSLLPALAITDTFVVVSQAAMLALTAQTGDVAVRSDLNKSFILRGTDPTQLSDWQELLTPTDAVLSVAGRTGAVTLVSADITDATSANTASRVVVRDGSGNFAAGTITATLTGNVTGNASTATALQTARTIFGQSFDGTGNVSGALTASTGAFSGILSANLGVVIKGASAAAAAANQIVIDLPTGGSPDPQVRWTAYGPDAATNAFVILSSRRSDNSNIRAFLTYNSTSDSVTLGASAMAVSIAGTLQDVIFGDSKGILLTTGMYMLGYDNGGGVKIFELRAGGTTVVMTDDSTKNVLLGAATGQILASAANAGETSLSVYDGDALSLKRVKMEAAAGGKRHLYVDA